MRRMAALIAVIAALVTPARGAGQPAIDAQMLLDLELLAEADPARHRDQTLAERMRMLDMLRRLESPAGAPAATTAPPATPPAGGAR